MEKNLSECTTKKRNTPVNTASGGIYGLAFIGALIYFIQQATTFWMGVLGFLKALVWPAIVIYKVMEFLEMWNFIFAPDIGFFPMTKVIAYIMDIALFLKGAAYFPLLKIPNHGSFTTMANPIHSFQYRVRINDSWSSKKTNVDKNFLGRILFAGKLFQSNYFN